MIEVGIAELACQRATEDDLAAMEKAMLALENEPDKYMHDVEFHDALAVASHNAMLASTIHLVNNLIADVRIRFWDLPNYQEKTNLSHASIFEAVKTRDAKKARHEMIEHLKIVDEFAQKYPERSDGLDEAPLPEEVPHRQTGPPLKNGGPWPFSVPLRSIAARPERLSRKELTNKPPHVNLIQ